MKNKLCVCIILIIIVVNMTGCSQIDNLMSKVALVKKYYNKVDEVLATLDPSIPKFGDDKTIREVLQDSTENKEAGTAEDESFTELLEAVITVNEDIVSDDIEDEEINEEPIVEEVDYSKYLVVPDEDPGFTDVKEAYDYNDLNDAQKLDIEVRNQQIAILIDDANLHYQQAAELEAIGDIGGAEEHKQAAMLDELEATRISEGK